MHDHSLELLQTVNDNDLDQLNQLLQQLNPDSAGLTLQRAQAVLAAGTAWILVIRNKQARIVGSATLIWLPKLEGKKQATLEDVVVEATVRGQGLGKKLVQAALRLAKDKGMEEVILSSRPTRTAANQLYQKLGFTQYQTNKYRLLL